MPGRPDIVFPSRRLAVFCDGDFWHGKDWPRRRQKLEGGANGSYWVAKIEANRARDRRNTAALQSAGWTVLRVWESAIRTDARGVALDVLEVLARLTESRRRA